MRTKLKARCWPCVRTIREACPGNSRWQNETQAHHARTLGVPDFSPDAPKVTLPDPNPTVVLTGRFGIEMGALKTARHDSARGDSHADAGKVGQQTVLCQ